MSTKRPERRKSDLRTRPPAAPASWDGNNAAPAAAPPKKTADGRNRKMTFYLDDDDASRIRGALLHTMAQEGTRSLTDFIHKAVLKEVERLEATYNNGEPFPKVAAGSIPRGRPVGDY
ncbi:hypothetical protein [Nesterenkonia sp.]|uniref:ParB family protein n=1 Tax=Nesterenkonia sp. TaxID=704201 RepID=UPI0026182FA1|nr:hypothetical protein [Nesterenkonia sp.]